ncbi:MAG: DUF2267 domain-containing protein [Burkholderiales bacterium]
MFHFIIASDEGNIKLMTCGPRERPRNPVDCVREDVFWSFLGKLPTLGYFDVDELIQLVAQRAGISSAQAALAVATMLGFLTARLPSPVVGRIREQLGEVPFPYEPDRGEGGAK